MLTAEQIKNLKNIRHHLHTMPEIAGSEKKTAEFIKKKLQESGADKVIEGVGGYGLIAIFEGKKNRTANSIMIRAELDALAIDEQSDIPYRSKQSKRMHACGHDGHMTIVLGVAEWLKENKPEKGRVILLFQPAEEVGKGADQMLNDSEVKNLNIDRGIALHNLPGYKKNTIYIRTKTFALASVGVKITFHGKSSHAAYPEEGINPSFIISKLVTELEEMERCIADSDQFQVLTITYIKVGKPAFGMNPGNGEMGITIRAETGKKIDQLFSDLENIIHKIKNDFAGEIRYGKKEPFAATVNDQAGVDKLIKLAKKLNIAIEVLVEPIGWSEDFGEFRKKCPITLFGIGAGEDNPPLHSESYDFDDDLIPTGVSVFCEWINDELNG